MSKEKTAMILTRLCPFHFCELQSWLALRVPWHLLLFYALCDFCYQYYIVHFFFSVCWSTIYTCTYKWTVYMWYYRSSVNILLNFDIHPMFCIGLITFVYFEICNIIDSMFKLIQYSSGDINQHKMIPLGEVWPLWFAFQMQSPNHDL